MILFITKKRDFITIKVGTPIIEVRDFIKDFLQENVIRYFSFGVSKFSLEDHEC